MPKKQIDKEKQIDKDKQTPEEKLVTSEAAEHKELTVEEQKALTEKRQAELAAKERKDVVISPAKIVWNNFKSRKMTLIGVVIFAIILFLVLIVPIFTPSNLNDINVANRYNSPSASAWFGNDALGRDYFNRVLTGGRVSLYVGAIATTISTIIGVLIGSVSGYFGGVVDNILQRFTEVVRSFPFLPLIITLSAAIGADWNSDQKILLVMVILGLIGWTGLARLLRGQILSIREQEYILAAKATGVRDYKIILRHIIPNVVSIIIVSATLSFAVNILVESGLSFLGFGVNEPDASWGLLLKQGTQSSIVIQDYPWLWIFPGTLILLTVLSINFIGDGLRDAIDPRNNTK